MSETSAAEMHKLNILMAEKVMGWPKRSMATLYPSIRVWKDGDVHLFRKEQSQSEEWSPATDPAQAVEVAAAFGKSFDYQSQPCWITSSTRFDGTDWEANWNSLKVNDEHVVIFHDPFPLAICRAISSALDAGATRKPAEDGR